MKRSDVGGEGGEGGEGAVFGLGAGFGGGAEGDDPGGEVGDAGVAVAAEARGDGGLVAGGHDVVDVAGVAVGEEPLVVGREVGVAEHVAARPSGPRRPRRSAQRTTGTPATMRGAGRPASVAALVMRGTTYSPMARSSAIQRIVPDACDPASRSITGASAAISTGIGTASVTFIGLCTRYESFSTSTVPGPANAACSTSRWSRTSRAGFS